MNIFDSYLKEILNLIKINKKKLDLKDINNFKGVNLEIPPPNIDSDLSTNICMILAKLNNLDPNKLANNVRELINSMVVDVMNTTNKNLMVSKPKSASDICRLNYALVNFSKEMKKIDNHIKEFLKNKMYNHKKVIIGTLLSN